MKRISLIMIVMMAVLLVACGPSEVEPEETPETGPALEQAPEGEGDTLPRPTITATTGSGPGAVDSYPARPTTTPRLEGYPEPAQSQVNEPYPAEGGSTLFVMIPAGVQCETAAYDSEAAAAKDLEAAGIEVLSTQTIEMMVITSCGSPTSTHYVAEISAADFEAAEALDWEEISAEELEQY